MFCCISNCVPHEPVVSRNSGCLYERSLVEAHVTAHGTCPVTGEPLRMEDIIPVRRGALTSASPASDTIPGLLERFHAQWDAVMLEQYALRQRLAQTQQELAHALHQYEAACRVIATFMKDREASHAAPHDKEESVPDDMIQRIDEQEASQRAARRLRAPPPTLSSVETIQNFSEVRCVNAGGAACALAWAGDNALLAGLSSGAIARVSLSSLSSLSSSSLSSLSFSSGHALAARHIARCGAAQFVSGGDDAALRLWTVGESENENENESESESFLRGGEVLWRCGGAVSGVAAVAPGAVFAAAAREVALCDVRQMTEVAKVSNVSDVAEIACVAAHPFGSLAAVGGGALCVWDVRKMCADTIVNISAGANVAAAAFAGDCVTLATAVRSGAVMIWDLRKMAAPLAEMPRGTGTFVAFDAYGKYLAVAGESVKVFDWAAAPNDAICALSGHKEIVTGVCWGTDAQTLASCSLDGTVRLYSAS